LGKFSTGFFFSAFIGSAQDIDNTTKSATHRPVTQNSSKHFWEILQVDLVFKKLSLAFNVYNSCIRQHQTRFYPIVLKALSGKFSAGLFFVPFVGSVQKIDNTPKTATPRPFTHFCSKHFRVNYDGVSLN
jgi:hypothetical protein